MNIGYARVSTTEQNLFLQEDALKKANCERIYKEKISGSTTKRPALERLMSDLRKGDKLIVWKLDRLGRSLQDLLNIVSILKDKGISFQSLNENIDTSTATGELVFHIFCSLSQFEKQLIRERTLAGLASARLRGKQLGRPKGLSKDSKRLAMLAASLYRKGESSNNICKDLNISRPTLYKYLKYESIVLRSECNDVIVSITDVSS